MLPPRVADLLLLFRFGKLSQLGQFFSILETTVSLFKGLW